MRHRRFRRGGQPRRYRAHEPRRRRGAGRTPKASGAIRNESLPRSPAALDHRSSKAARSRCGPPDGAVGVVFNGEIYNHAELRSELKALGADFRHRSLGHRGAAARRIACGATSFVGRLNGMWAFVIYDRARRRLFASRDRFGKKPFYYAAQTDLFAFASELAALSSHPRVNRTVSPLAVRKFFALRLHPGAAQHLRRACRSCPAGTASNTISRAGPCGRGNTGIS